MSALPPRSCEERLYVFTPEKKSHQNGDLFMCVLPRHQTDSHVIANNATDSEIRLGRQVLHWTSSKEGANVQDEDREAESGKGKIVVRPRAGTKEKKAVERIDVSSELQILYKWLRSRLPMASHPLPIMLF